MLTHDVIAALDPLYTTHGTIDIITDENSLFYWKGEVYNLENIACAYYNHAGIWDPTFGNVSYARIRHLTTGEIVHNISITQGYAFISPYVNYETDTLWLFGVEVDRCHDGCGNPTQVFSWSSPDLVTWQQRHLAFDYGKVTHNVQVSRVGSLPGGSRNWMKPASSLPEHKYIMHLECFAWAINNNADGNLSYGWELLNDTHQPNAPCGGPSMKFNPLDGYYYLLTGGNIVALVRTNDFQTWSHSKYYPFIQPQHNDSLIADLQNWPAEAKIRGSPPNAGVGEPEPFDKVPFDPYWHQNWTSWNWNSNDADSCCMHADVKTAHLIWGASTQGKDPSLPLTGSDAGANVIASADMPLTKFFAAAFD